MSNKNVNCRENVGEIIKQGYLKKLKTMKKKYFVLRGECGDSSACLEYYDNEKKFRAPNCHPKRAIKLKSCFNINHRKDTKHKYVIALYSRSGNFSIVLDSEEELDDWLKALLTLQLGTDTTPQGETIKPTFEHVWEVTLMDRDIGSKMSLLGPHHLCLTDQTLTLIKTSDNETFNNIEFPLQKIRACGYMNAFFYMQVGNNTVTGAGNLWMMTEDPNIAETMHATIKNAWGKCCKKELPQKWIESSKPSTPMQRWSTHSGEGMSPPHRSVVGAQVRLTNAERRHSLAAGSGGTWNTSGTTVVHHQRTYSFPLSPDESSSPQSPYSLSNVRDNIPIRMRTTSEPSPNVYRNRPHSMYNKAHSPPNNLLSPESVCGDSESSMDVDWDEPRYPHSLTPDEPVILEESYPQWPEDEKLNNYMPMDRSNLNTTCVRKISPNALAFKSSSPSVGSFGDVYSPSSSPHDSAGGCYLPMSPGETRLGGYHHSRGSSIAEEGYVTMAPTHSDDGYVDMDQKVNRDRYQSGNTSTGSSCSLNCGTPSGDLAKLSDSVDRVATVGGGYIPDEGHGPRGTRAYSCGSRPNNIPSKTDIIEGKQRERAFSWGSRNVPRAVIRMTAMMDQTSSHSSVEHGNDLMELDFSKKSKHMKNHRSKKPSSSERLSEGGGLSPPKAGGRLAALFGRSPPKPVSVAAAAASPPHPSPLLDRVPETEPGYLDMTPVSPDRSYVEMKAVVAPKNPLKPQNFPKTTCSPPIKPFSTKEDYMDMNLKRKTPTPTVEDNNNSKIVVGDGATDGYVEMNLKKGEDDSDYMNMGGGTPANHMEKKNRLRYASPPIKIESKEPRKGGSQRKKPPKELVKPESDYIAMQPEESRTSQFCAYMSMRPEGGVKAQPTVVCSVVESLRKGVNSVTLGSSFTEVDSNEEKSLSRTNSSSSFGDKEVQYASLDLQDRLDEGRCSTLQSPSYAEIDFAKSVGRKQRH